MSKISWRLIKHVNHEQTLNDSVNNYQHISQNWDCSAQLISHPCTQQKEWDSTHHFAWHHWKHQMGQRDDYPISLALFVFLYQLLKSRTKHIGTLRLISLANRRLWSTLSNALEASRNTLWTFSSSWSKWFQDVFETPIPRLLWDDFPSWLSVGWHSEWRQIRFVRGFYFLTLWTPRSFAVT